MAEAVEELGRTLIVTNVHNLIRVKDVRVLDILLDRVLNRLEHCWYITCAHLSERPVPVALRIHLVVKLHVLHAVERASIISEPHVVACFVQLDRHGLAVLRIGEPSVSGHTEAWHDEDTLTSSAMDRVVSEGTSKAEH